MIAARLPGCRAARWAGRHERHRDGRARRRYWRTWALRDCTLAIPSGRVTALTGPNGAGKTTLMHMAVGLIAPTEGRVTVLGGRTAGSPGALERMAFVAQDVPLYQHLPVEDMVRLARTLNGRHWDQRRADQRLAALGIPRRRKVGKLSGGQQAQVALTIALARRPEFLVLDPGNPECSTAPR